MAIRIAKRDDNPLKDVHPMSRNLAFWHTPKRLSEAAQCLAGSLANLLCNQSMSINQYLSIYLIIYIYIILYIRIYIYMSISSIYLNLMGILCPWSMSSLGPIEGNLLNHGPDFTHPGGRCRFLSQPLSANHNYHNLTTMRNVQNLGTNGCPYHITLHAQMSFHLYSLQAKI